MPRNSISYDPAFFWANVERTPTCWPWRKSKRSSGYGQCWFRQRVWTASRVAYILTYGDIDPSLDVLHTCDNPACCNPTHLWLGKASDNMKDCVRKGRIARGERHGNARLTAEQVKQIRKRAASGERHRVLAAEYGLHIKYIPEIVARKVWAHIM